MAKGLHWPNNEACYYHVTVTTAGFGLKQLAPGSEGNFPSGSQKPKGQKIVALAQKLHACTSMKHHITSHRRTHHIKTHHITRNQITALHFTCHVTSPTSHHITSPMSLIMSHRTHGWRVIMSHRTPSITSLGINGIMSHPTSSHHIMQTGRHRIVISA